MNETEQHMREANLNAHFCWALAMWGSAEVASENESYLVASFGYYYSAFHAVLAMISTDHTFHLEDMSRITHEKVESWLESRGSLVRVLDFKLLRSLREVTSYLGVGDPISKLRVVRGHPFGFDLGGEHVTFFASIDAARSAARNLLDFALAAIGLHCEAAGWRGPRRGDRNWLEEYLQEDALLWVVPRGGSGAKLLAKAFAVLEIA